MGARTMVGTGGQIRARVGGSACVIKQKRGQFHIEIELVQAISELLPVQTRMYNTNNNTYNTTINHGGEGEDKTGCGVCERCGGWGKQKGTPCIICCSLLITLKAGHM